MTRVKRQKTARRRVQCALGCGSIALLGLLLGAQAALSYARVPTLHESRICAGDLGDADLEHRDTCPLHGWRFDVTTGENAFPGHEGIGRYDVLVEDGAVWVRP